MIFFNENCPRISTALLPSCKQKQLISQSKGEKSRTIWCSYHWKFFNFYEENGYLKKVMVQCKPESIFRFHAREIHYFNIPIPRKRIVKNIILKFRIWYQTIITFISYRARHTWRYTFDCQWTNCGRYVKCIGQWKENKNWKGPQGPVL